MQQAFLNLKRSLFLKNHVLVSPTLCKTIFSAVLRVVFVLFRIVEYKVNNICLFGQAVDDAYLVQLSHLVSAR